MLLLDEPVRSPLVRGHKRRHSIQADVQQIYVNKLNRLDRKAVQKRQVETDTGIELIINKETDK